MGDVIRHANIIRVEHHPSTNGWLAVVGPDIHRGLMVYGYSPTSALLQLAADMRENDWPLDESYADCRGALQSPNVIHLRRLGPPTWNEWYASSFGPKPVTAHHWDATIALSAFALQLREKRYLFDAEFRIADFAVLSETNV